MKHFITILLISIFLAGCTYESQQPQKTFAISSSVDDLVKARLLLHTISIQNNLLFRDHSHKYPSDKLIVTAVAERVDGLQIILTGASDLKDINISIHCHKKCSDWEEIYDITTTEFSKHWKLMYDKSA